MTAKTTLCEYCSKQFNRKSNYLRHIKSVHSRNSKGEIVPAGEKFTCPTCNKQYSSKTCLDYHIRAFHLEELKCCTYCNFKTHHKFQLRKHIENHEKNQESLKAFTKRFKCADCDSSFIKESRLRSHRREKHNEPHSKPIPVITKKCPLCPFIAFGPRNKQIYSHFKNSHDICLEWEQHYFSSEQEFYDWKIEIERNTLSYFYKQTNCENNGVSNCIYRCHRSGTFKSQSRNIRRLKLSGSCKINGFCPAAMKTTVDAKGVQVSYLACHVGHKCEAEHLRLTKDTRQSIAMKLASGKPCENISQWISSSIPNADLNRFYLTNKQDILNIDKSLNLHEEPLEDHFDPVRIEAWVRNVKELKSTTLLVFKPQGQESVYYKLSKNDFLLIYMTETQKEMLLTYGLDTICVDRSHGLSNSNFQLFTVLTFDDSREGFPVAFMFTNRQDEHVMNLFFEAVKHITGKLNTKVYMSGIEDFFYSAWDKIMGPSQLSLFCSWHVLQAWKENIVSKIKSKDKQNDVFSILKSLLYELDTDTFKGILSKTIEKFKSDRELDEFFKYFQKHYLYKVKVWALCLRVDAEVNTNISMDNFNRVLKYFYLKGKKVYHLEKTLNIILDLLTDKLFDLLIKMARGKMFAKLRNLRAAHKRSLWITNEQILKDYSKWQVLSSSQSDFYTVKKVKDCNSCQLQCLNCNSCFHEFVCTCMESCIKNNMCKHIHAVAKTLKRDDIESGPEGHLRFTVETLPTKEHVEVFAEDSSDELQEETSSTEENFEVLIKVDPEEMQEESSIVESLVVLVEGDPEEMQEETSVEESLIVLVEGDPEEMQEETSTTEESLEVSVEDFPKEVNEVTAQNGDPLQILIMEDVPVEEQEISTEVKDVKECKLQGIEELKEIANMVKSRHQLEWLKKEFIRLKTTMMAMDPTEPSPPFKR